MKLKRQKSRTSYRKGKKIVGNLIKKICLWSSTNFFFTNFPSHDFILDFGGCASKQRQQWSKKPKRAHTEINIKFNKNAYFCDPIKAVASCIAISSKQKVRCINEILLFLCLHKTIDLNRFMLFHAIFPFLFIIKFFSQFFV